MRGLFALVNPKLTDVIVGVGIGRTGIAHNDILTHILECGVCADAVTDFHLSGINLDTKLALKKDGIGSLPVSRRVVSDLDSTIQDSFSCHFADPPLMIFICL